MNIRKISLLFLAVVGISLIMVSIMPMKVFAGAPPSGKEQYLSRSDEKTKKVENPHQSTFNQYFHCDENSHIDIYFHSHKNSYCH